MGGLLVLLLACGPGSGKADVDAAIRDSGGDEGADSAISDSDTDTGIGDTDTGPGDTDTGPGDTDTRPPETVERSVETDASATILCEPFWEWGSDGGTFRAAAGGDVDGDGVEDIVAGCYGCGDGAEGRAWMLAGPFSGTTSVADAAATFDLTQPYGLGLEVAGAGDVDGDGFDDLLLTEARFHVSDGAGRVLLVAGPVTGTMDPEDVAIAAFVGEYAADWYYPGFAAGYEDGVGDFDGDGVAELYVSAPYWNGVGAAYAVSGPFGGEVALATDATFTFENDGPAPTGAVADLGDVNGDGLDDLAIGLGAAGAGVLVYLGPLSGVRTPAEADSVWGTAGETGVAGDRGGLASAGDVNGDGYADAIAASPLLEDGGDTVGGAYLVAGPFGPTVSLVDAEAILRDAGIERVVVDGPGDLDGDGRDDLVVGSAPAHRPGDTFLLLGPVRGATSLDDAPSVIHGTGGAEVGAVVDHADFDGDGLPDLLLTGPGNGGDVGAAWIVGGVD